MKKPEIKFYSAKEEKINVVSHAAGFFLSMIALVFLVVQASLHGGAWEIVSFSIFGLSLITLYAASTLYHNATEPLLRYKLKIFDHSSIYVLIAGTFTPFSLILMEDSLGLIILCIAWSLAAVGITLKLFFTGRFNLLSTIMYVLMSWSIIFAIKPLVNNLDSGGVLWLFAGGVSYTIGAVLYSIKKIRYNHAIFHLLVLVGSFCHFISVFFYVLPPKMP